ncbi:uncharacterized protein LOC110838384 isoform X2 [Zootermopsis nevadensis]|uniref:Uncharacterized protein n=1 Tax=Zootermopsis nevadensis TaxID=136037 RepID=A0A067QLD7_ZOONE|nr:uncharacterized protein LOC110838384 isoform X2 [Zootermopsis nevadensis]KDR09916.1 hypothetical protein L798_00353 [Zootermopsis nevadensis]
MAGLLFVVCVPTSEYEVNLAENLKGKSVSSNSTNEDFIQQFTDNKSDSLHSLRKTISTTDTLYETDDTSISYISKTPKECSTATINSDGNNQERSNINVGRISKCHPKINIDKPCEITLKPEETFHHEHLPRVKEGTSDLTKVQCFEETIPMKKVLELVLEKLKIDNAVWCSGENGQYYQVFFTVGSGERCEEILRHLNESGIGVRLNSVVSVIPCTLHYQGKQPTSIEDCPDLQETDESKQKSAKLSAWDKFVLSVRARLTVAQVVEGVRADANLTFDFLVLLVLSGIVAALGLAENSTVILVASMLISPLMGPIMAGTFGTVIVDRQLQKMGVLNELIGLLVCLVVGFIFGLAAGLANEHWGNGGWPTDEMIARGQIRSLWVGLLVALPSGAAVAIAILVDNTASLVGVAISASLMPPAVNAGLFWALACMDILWQGRMQLEDDDPNAVKSYSPIYSENPRVELLVLGTVSLCLTLVNIICIFVAGIIVLKIKEVAPRTSKDQMQFWKHDIKIARDYNRTFHGEDAEEIQKRLAEEIARTKLQSNLNAVAPNVYSLSCHNSTVALHEVFNPIATSESLNQLTWSPSTVGINQERRPTLYDLEKMYTTISTARGQGTLDVQPLQRRKRRHSGGVFCLGGSEVNGVTCTMPVTLPQAADLSGNTVLALPTITERNRQHLLGSDPSTSCSYPSISPKQPSLVTAAAVPYGDRRVFTVTLAEDPISNV